MDRDILIVVISQLPLVLYTVVSGFSKLKSDIRKTNSDAASSLGNALTDAGETLEGAWAEIRTLRQELNQEREARKRTDGELRRWTRYASQLAKQAIDSGLPPIPFPPESDPSIKL